MNSNQKPSYYITTAIDYVNGNPHIGHALEKVQADALARYQKLLGKDVFFATGTDEHGAKIVRAAEQKGTSVKEFVDENANFFKSMDDSLNISYDLFIRTSDEEKHWGNVIKVWNELYKNGDIYKKQYQGMYCVGHEAFVTKKDLNSEGICELHNAKPEIIEEENYFFKLSKYTDKIKQAIESGELDIQPKERKNEVLSVIAEGLEDVSFSRPRKDLSWGIPVPNDDTQTMYVWVDALTNYLSALDYESNSDLFQKHWSPEIQVIGKDILRFHAIIWIGMLISLNLKLPKCILAHGFISVDGVKMSKSIGNVIDPMKLIDKYGADPVRYFLLSEIPTTQDGDFSYEKFEARYNADLALGFSNFVSRVTVLGDKHLNGFIDNIPSKSARSLVADYTEKYHRSMETYAINEAISHIRSMIQWGDKRINDTRLWELPDTKKDKFIKGITDMAYILVNVSWLLLPIIPESASEALKRCGFTEEVDSKVFKIKKGNPIFQRI